MYASHLGQWQQEEERAVKLEVSKAKQALQTDVLPKLQQAHAAYNEIISFINNPEADPSDMPAAMQQVQELESVIQELENLKHHLETTEARTRETQTITRVVARGQTEAAYRQRQATEKARAQMRRTLYQQARQARYPHVY